MSTGKYGKYVFEMYSPPFRPSLGNCEIDLINYDRSIDENAPFRLEILHLNKEGAGSGFGTDFLDFITGEIRQQLPHKHVSDEFYVFTSTDPENPLDLGAELELWLGEGDDAEKLTITKTTTIRIPAGTVHLPFLVKSVKRNFIMMAIVQAPILQDASINVLPTNIEKPDWAKN